MQWGVVTDTGPRSHIGLSLDKNPYYFFVPLLCRKMQGGHAIAPGRVYVRTLFEQSLELHHVTPSCRFDDGIGGRKRPRTHKERDQTYDA
jgi:hypothetical protein